MSEISQEDAREMLRLLVGWFREGMNSDAFRAMAMPLITKYAPSPAKRYDPFSHWRGGPGDLTIEHYARPRDRIGPLARGV